MEDERRGLPMVVWVLIGFVASFTAIGGGVLLGRSQDDDRRDSTTEEVAGASTTSATAAPPASTTTAAPALLDPGPGGLTVGDPERFEWPRPDLPPFPFPVPAEVRGRVEEERRCPADGGDEDDEDDEDDDQEEEAGSTSCLASFAFTLVIDDEAVTVEDVTAFLERFPVAAAWSPVETAVTAGDAVASFTFNHACGGGCGAVVQIDLREPERRNRGPRLEVVVTFSDH